MLACRRSVFAVLFVYAGCHAVLAGPKERDVWYAFVDGDQRYGYQHVQVAKAADGNYRYAVNTRMLLDVLGAQRQEITGHAEYVVTPDLWPVSLTGDWTLMSGSSRVRGLMDGRKLTLTIVRSGIESVRSYQIDQSEEVIFGPCLDDYLASLPESTDEAVVKTIEEDRWSMDTITVKRARRDGLGPTWEIQTADILGKGTMLCDEDGVMREMVYRMPKLHIKRCTVEEAKDIDYRVLTGPDMLTFPLDKNISDPYRLKDLTVKLAWENIPFEEFELEDARQRLIETSHKDGQYTATVHLSPLDPIKDKIPFPIKGKEFEPYLAETDFVKPADEGIIEVARKVVAGKPTALEAVRALSTWVNGHLDVAMIAETLSDPEALARKKGKCSEYATLFASLARAVGIPTRLVLGDRMVAGQWIGHMWNEAYVGRWIPVDAGTNEVGESFTLLKFIHADSVRGTQPLRWKLTESLDISIADFKLTPSGLADKYQTAIEGNVYTNVDYACRLTAPDESWVIEDKSGPGALTIRFNIQGADEVLIHFVAFRVPPDMAPKTLVDARMGYIRTKYDSFTVIMNEPREINGLRGHTWRFNGVPKANSKRKKTVTEVLWTASTSGYLLNLIAQEADHTKYLVDFEKLLASFEHLE